MNKLNKMAKFQSTKIFDGYSTVFRQWRAKDTHCSFLHGYGISFKIIFEGELDERNWVWDFGGMKRAKGTIDGMSPKVWMDYMFDHTYIIAEDDPFVYKALEMHNEGIVQLRVIPATGAEQFAKFIYDKVSKFISEETNNRVRVVSVEFKEHEKNSAIYGE
jgi:6-pyruvoyltetrahydropterin/6-carboxytetrahydropterin synthase